MSARNASNKLKEKISYSRAGPDIKVVQTPSVAAPSWVGGIADGDTLK
jgi:hypothetical protein